MESFEKAHVLKRNKPTDKKTEENKKRLKQMLYGYKHNDNVTIKKSANRRVDLEYINTLSEDDIDISPPETSDNEAKVKAKENTTNASPTDLEDRNAGSDLETRSVKISSIKQQLDNENRNIAKSSEDELSSAASYECSFDNVTSPEQGSETETFDADGELTSIILKKLSKIDKYKEKSAKKKKDPKKSVHSKQTESSQNYKYSSGLEAVKKNKEKVKAKKIKKDLSVKEILDSRSNVDDQPCHSNSTNVHVEHNKEKTKKKKTKKETKNKHVNKLVLKKKDKTSDVFEIDHNVEEFMDIGENSYLSPSNNLSDDESIVSASTNSFSMPVITFEAEESILYQGFNDILSAYKNPTVTCTPSAIPIISGQTKMFTSSYDNDAADATYGADTTQNFEDIDVQDDCSLVEVSSIEGSPQFSPEPERQDLEEPDQLLNVQDDAVDLLAGIVQNELGEPMDYSKNYKLFLHNNLCILKLQHPAELFIHGKVRVIPLGGTAEIFGYVLKDPCNVYAPHFYPPHCLKTVECENSYYGLFRKLSSIGLPVCDAEDIVSQLGPHDVVVQLKPTESYKLDFVENNFSATDLFKKGNNSADEHLLKLSKILGCSLTMTRPMRYFNESVSPAVMRGFNKQSRCLVAGGKGAGKSTFVRFYVNQLLAQSPVLVLDLDPGQSEFTVAGNISATVVKGPLIGPSFTHLQHPDRMLNVGMINVMDNLRRYANAVSSLIAYCSTNEQYSDMPWVVNTMGMCNTVGLKLISLIILHLKPTFVLQFQSHYPKRKFECNLEAVSVIHKYYTEFKDDELFRYVCCPEKLDYSFLLSDQSRIDDIILGKGKGNFCLAPREERYLNFLSYFGELLDIHKGPGFLSITPYEVPLQHLKIGANVKLDAEAIDKVINGKVIALCQQEQDSSGKMFTLNDKPLLCHGHGLIRGIDYEKGMVYIVTPAPVDRLSLVDTVVYADWVPELRGQESHLPAGTPVPYRMPTLHQRQLTHVPRRRFNPLKFLKMSRNS